MAAAFKDMFTYDSLLAFASSAQTIHPSFPVENFMTAVFDEEWESLAFQARIRKISRSLGKVLPSDYREALSILEQAVTGYTFAWFFPDFIEVYGLNEWEVSMTALERTTQYWSAEFAVRAFIIKDEQRMMAQMLSWTQHESEHVRRLASEGCRSRLPWGCRIPHFVQDPSPILPILNQLKEDPSLYVRKSVANNLNDISKDHPDIVIKLAKAWFGKQKTTDWILHHGCRTLLKEGNQEVLALFGLLDTSNLITIEKFILETEQVSMGDDLIFSFSIIAKEDVKIRLEYAIDFVRTRGKKNRKIFQISKITLKKGTQKNWIKKHSFKNVSVRTYYPGTHTITLIINGREQGQYDFKLVE